MLCLGFLAVTFRLGRDHAHCIRVEVIYADVVAASKAALMTVLEALRLVVSQNSRR